MAASFFIHTDQLRGSGRRLSSAGEGVDAERGTLRTAVAGDAGTWGADELGAAFGQAHLEVAELAERALAVLARATAEVGTSLIATATELEDIDRTHADELNKLLSELGNRS
ncbi:hypothetical protein [Saccharopolyspora gloriosae]|uniref:hypothetical protein n=1 Tax=Saccharopolyspora gloriosae TaxID=455344 RepID=UPI001FB7C5E9|nr:hypothetical protein [Saccharopolyspora gloriosae]